MNIKYGTIGYALLIFIPLILSIFLIVALTSGSMPLLKSHEDKIFAQYKEHIFGIDISHYQGKVNWDRLGYFNNGIEIDFVIMRASIGKDEEDQQFALNWINAKENGRIRGAYHYYRPDENSIEQANNFIEIVKLEKGDLPPVLDIEAIPNVQSIRSLKKGLLKWLTRVEKHFGIRPIIYTADSYYKDFLSDNSFQKYQFWIANFNKIRKPIHKNWIIWQFSETGQIDGINHDVDFNIFKGSLEDLQKMTFQ